MADPIVKVSMAIDNNIDLLSQDLLQLVVKDTILKITSENGNVTVQEIEVEPDGNDADGDSSSDDSLQWEVSTDDDRDDEY